MCRFQMCYLKKWDAFVWVLFLFESVWTFLLIRFFVSSSIVEPQNVFLQERRHDFLPELDCAIAKMSSHWLWLQRVILRCLDGYPTKYRYHLLNGWCWSGGNRGQVGLWSSEPRLGRMGLKPAKISPGKSGETMVNHGKTRRFSLSMGFSTGLENASRYHR